MRILLVVLLIVLSKMSYDFLDAQRVYAKSIEVKAAQSEIFQAQQRSACLHAHIPKAIARCVSKETVTRLSGSKAAL